MKEFNSRALKFISDYDVIIYVSLQLIAFIWYPYAVLRILETVDMQMRLIRGITFRSKVIEDVDAFYAITSNCMFYAMFPLIIPPMILFITYVYKKRQKNINFSIAPGSATIVDN